MKAYLINLDERPDRLARAKHQFELIGLSYERISAIKPTNNFSKLYPLVTPGVAAIWLSHMYCLEKFLKSGEESALIFEDDFSFTKKALTPAFLTNLPREYDLFQIGFLKTNVIDKIDFLIANTFDLYLKFLCCLSRFPSSKLQRLQSRFLVSDQLGAPWGHVRHDVRPGAHAYLVSREFASYLVELNNPLVFSTDAFFISLAKMRSFNMARFRRSQIGQDGSKSSVATRFRTQS